MGIPSYGKLNYIPSFDASGMERDSDRSCLISRGLYNVVQDAIGSERIVELRRRKCEIIDVLNNTDREGQYTQLVRGSRAEGFKVHSSDIDVMFVDRKTIVLSQHHLNSLINVFVGFTILTFENSYPGFVIIRCLEFCEPNEHIRRCLVRRGNKMYLSSRLYKEHVYDTIYKPRFSLHGPCVRCSYADTDFDIGFCLQCAFWPEQAISFFHRTVRASWPPRNVLIDISRDGCLLVPINSKENIHYRNNSDIEWRFSFSLAEKKIMQSLNHCQFLCYGLLKICLNDILKPTPNISDLLCSYHMKTAMFWEICENPDNWVPISFVSKFWIVFRRIIDWVIHGYCPHFFVPQRNMFFARLNAQKRMALEVALRSLYSRDELCFLQCPTIAESFLEILKQPLNVVYSSTDDEADIYAMQLEMISCFQKTRPDNLESAYYELKGVMQLQDSEPDSISFIIFRIHHILQSIADICLSTQMENKVNYQTQRSACNILKRSKTFYLMNKIILIKHIYTSKRYQLAIELAEEIKSKLNLVTYIWNLDQKIINIALRYPLTSERIIKTFVLSYVSLNVMTTIDELRLECHAKCQYGMNAELRIPPLVFLQLLLVLSYHNISDLHNRDKALREFHSLLFCDDNCHIHILLRAISWEILGICQKLCGYRKDAETSSLKALEDSSNDFKVATTCRLNGLRND